MEKRRCSLCGGTLRGNRCTLCGLDNSKSDEKYIVHRGKTAVEEVHIKEAKKKSAYKKEQAVKKEKIQDAMEDKKKDVLANAHGPKHQARKLLVILLVLVLIGKAPTLFKALQDDDMVVGQEEISDTEPEEETGNIASDIASKISEESEGKDLYENVQYEIPEKGYHFVREIHLTAEDLKPLTLTVGGKDLPEGVYTIELIKGSGKLCVHDQENLFYHVDCFSKAGVEDGWSVTKEEDVRLYKGAELMLEEFEDGVWLKLTTNNAQE